MAMPAPDPGLRARIERLLRGDFHPEDLYSLFLYARDRCDGRESVQEVGDFVAHHSERTKGIVTRTVRDWYLTARFHWQLVETKTLDWSRLPSDFDEILLASFRRIPAPMISRRIGLTRGEVKKRLPAITKGLKQNIDGSMALNSFYTRRELKIIETLADILVAGPAFNNDRLFSDFSATLKCHGLLSHSEMGAFADLKPAIGLFAAAEMHNCTVRLADGASIRLKINDVVGAKKITVSAPILCSVIRGSPIFVASAMFSTEVEAQQGCTAELLALPDPWDLDIELTRDKLLSKLG
jgi:hypothetical protein